MILMEWIEVPTHESAEASINDAEASLVVRNLSESFNAPVIVGADHPVGLKVDLIDASWRDF